jgi:hypothetical protein
MERCSACGTRRFPANFPIIETLHFLDSYDSGPADPARSQPRGTPLLHPKPWETRETAPLCGGQRIM